MRKLELTFQNLKKLRNYLNKEAGIYIEDSKLDNIYKRKLAKFLTKQSLNLEELFKELILRKNSILRQEFINMFTINETYFFREDYQFDTLINIILPQLDAMLPKDESINILCAPASTGEELYSIAIYILEEKSLIKHRNFMLLGIDIDSNAIKKAKEGMYSYRSIQKLPPYILNKYFTKTGNSYRINNILKDAVNLKVVNVFDRYTMKRLGKFDIIFSRNMLIYFNENSKREAIEVFHSILKDNGYLFLGHAENIPNTIKLFQSVKLKESFVYKKNIDS